MGPELPDNWLMPCVAFALQLLYIIEFECGYYWININNFFEQVIWKLWHKTIYKLLYIRMQIIQNHTIYYIIHAYYASIGANVYCHKAQRKTPLATYVQAHFITKMQWCVRKSQVGCCRCLLIQAFVPAEQATTTIPARTATTN